LQMCDSTIWSEILGLLLMLRWGEQPRSLDCSKLSLNEN
jgi:hypothetical protein